MAGELESDLSKEVLRGSVSIQTVELTVGLHGLFFHDCQLSARP